MKLLLHALRLDFLLQWRYKITAVAAFISLAYFTAEFLLRQYINAQVAALLVFSDPVMMGFIFVGVMLFYEKDARTLQAVGVSPLRPWQYIFSKGISFSLLAIPVALAITFFAMHTEVLYLLRLLYALLCTSLTFVFLGIAGAARVRSFNQFIIVIPMFLLPLCLPLVALWTDIGQKWMYLIPTYASLLFIEYGRSLSVSQCIYALLYLPLAALGAYLLAQDALLKQIRNQ